MSARREPGGTFPDAVLHADGERGRSTALEHVQPEPSVDRPVYQHGTALYSGPGAEEVCDAVDRLLQRVS